MWPKILLGAFLLPMSRPLSLVMVATGYEQWTVVNLLLPVSESGRRPFPY